MGKNKTSILYLNVFIGALGLVLIIIGAYRYVENVGGTGSYIHFFGFIFTMIYINHLENRAGISKKIIWIRAAVPILTLLVIYYFLF
ncbi:hypothetical protein GCM10008967_28020 [Bacillus carboniphilus]|uniref:Uncharacterized protein n=1 Tax=Bacillus carboniphilus TaxID=86663 RepID=A0ABN0WFN5_9BACI